MNLSQRKSEILIATIEDYIKNASPITSNSIKEKHICEVSSATLRNELNSLEAMGFLKQLHASSGRVPTADGYRYYVEWLLKDFKIEPAKIEKVSEILKERSKTIGEIISELAKIISETTNYPTVIMMNGYNNLVIEEIKIIPLIDDSALILIKTPNGIVNNTIKTKACGKSCEDAGRILTKKFCGQTIGFLINNFYEVEREINKEVTDFRLLVDNLLEGLKELSENKTVNIKSSIKLLENNQGKDINNAKKTFEILEDQKNLEILLNTDEKDLSIKVADEKDEFSGVAVVKAPILLSGKQVGTIGVLGPQRMDYSLIASALKFLVNEMENLDKLEEKNE